MDSNDKGLSKLNTNKLIVTIAVLTVIAGILVILGPYLQEKKEIAYNSMVSEVYEREVLANLDNVEGEEETPTEEPSDPGQSSGGQSPTQKPQEPSTAPQPVKPQNNYIGMLQIDKINLNRGFVDPSSKYNDIKYNVTIIKGSTFPDVKNGNFILAAHSGSGPLAIFKNLYKLQVGDKAVVTYKNKKYTYKIVKIYYQKKQGYIAIYRNGNKSTLTLVTCTKNDSKSQTVYIAELI